MTPANLEQVGDNLFISRLPFTYSEADRVIAEAVREDAWTDVENDPQPKGSRPRANHRVCDTKVNLYGKEYRAVVAHSDAHDKRAQKKLEKLLSSSLEEAGGVMEEVGKVEYFCREDAQAAADKLRNEGSSCHYPE